MLWRTPTRPCVKNVKPTPEIIQRLQKHKKELQEFVVRLCNQKKKRWAKMRIKQWNKSGFSMVAPPVLPRPPLALRRQLSRDGLCLLFRAVSESSDDSNSSGRAVEEEQRANPPSPLSHPSSLQRFSSTGGSRMLVGDQVHQPLSSFFRQSSDPFDTLQSTKRRANEKR